MPPVVCADGKITFYTEFYLTSNNCFLKILFSIRKVNFTKDIVRMQYNFFNLFRCNKMAFYSKFYPMTATQLLFNF